MLFDLLLENEKFKENVYDINVKKKDIKSLQDKFRKLHKSDDNFLYNMSDLAIISGCNINHKDCLENCRDFLQGYPTKEKKNGFQSFVNSIILCDKIQGPKNIFDYTAINKFSSKDNTANLRIYPGDDNGYSFSKPEDIISHMSLLSDITNPFSKYIVFKSNFKFSK